MAKSSKQSKRIKSKRKNSYKKNGKKYTQKTGKRNCKVPVFFVGGSSSNLPYPINTHEVDLRGGVSTRIMPNMNGGKSKRKRKGTRKRAKKMKGGSVVISESNPVISGISVDGAHIGGNIVSGVSLPSDKLQVPATLNTLNV